MRTSKCPFISAFAFVILPALAANAQPVTTLYSFSGPDGASPHAALTLGADGFYGTTSAGGNGSGTIYKITLSGTLTTLYTFSGTDGARPSALTLGSDGNFYGTTAEGGPVACSGTVLGCGTIFKITPTGGFTALYNFSGPDGSEPNALTFGSDHNLYGTTAFGGANGVGSSCTVASQGCGTIFRIPTTGGPASLTTLYSFAGPDGWEPAAGLTLSGSTFYGTTFAGGVNGPGCSSLGKACGTIFKFVPSGSSGTLTTLHGFSGPDGSGPLGVLTLGSDGNFYGTTYVGGAGGTSCPNGTTECGTVFRATPTGGPGGFTSLVSFAGPNGEEPNGGLIQGTDGNYYGTASLGGSHGSGTIFRIAPAGGAGSLVTLFSFSGPDGAFPSAPLTIGSDGHFYGTTYGGGASGAGTIFRVNCVPGSTGCTSTSLVSSLNPSTVGTSVTFTATVTAVSGSNKPTGTVAFADGGNSLGSMGLAGGVAALSTAALSAGSHNITATYSGDGNFQPSAGSLTQTVSKAVSKTTVVSSVNPSVFNQAITFTATVAPTTGSGTPTGSVVFRAGGRTVGTGTLSGGSTTITPSVLAAGTNAITASYAGDTNFQASKGTLSQVVHKATTTAALQSSAKTVAVNQQVTFTVTLAGQAGGFPTGTVTFSANGTQIGAPATVSGKRASVTTSFSNAGSYTIRAAYSGDSNFDSSNATPLTETVN